jgi:GH35 family endo-1,4-beta-xylanase
MTTVTHEDGEGLSLRARALWDAVEGRIADGVRRRRRELAVRTVDAEGVPVPHARLRLRLRRHAFLFGANLFLAGHFSDAGRDRRWASLFGADRLEHPGALFNAGTLAFYWLDLEPERGRLRLSADAPPRHRRPPADLAVGFGEGRGLDLNGHCLAWDAPGLSLPAWLPPDPVRRASLLALHIQGLCRRYAGRVRRWDVVNEPVRRWSEGRFADQPMPPDYERLAFASAQAALPGGALLSINEGGDLGGPWRRSFAESYRGVVRDLRARGARIGGIGLQFHQFALDRLAAAEGDPDPVAIWDELDRFAELGLPLHISEITMAQPTRDEAGRRLQAGLTRRFYRLFYAHAAVHGATWWNTVDGTAWEAENHVDSGLLDADCRPKPVHAALDGLINREWAPEVEAESDGDGAWSGQLTAGEWEVAAAAGASSGTAAASLGDGGGTVHVRLAAPEAR